MVLTTAASIACRPLLNCTLRASSSSIGTAVLELHRCNGVRKASTSRTLVNNYNSSSRNARTRPAQTRKRPFVDSLRIRVEGGHGGQGLKRYGGVGGNGGSVYCVADTSNRDHNSVALNRLQKLCPDLFWTGGRGHDSQRMAVQGLPGRDTYIPTPPGVTLMDDNTQEFLGEINTSEDKILVSRGGDGGTPASQYRASPGQQRFLRIDYKLIADVGFVGYPNAGKSSLMSVLCGATPRIAAYPFTTLRPELGVISYSDYRQISLADLPGLIEGAHLNMGLGYEFLKHVERTNLLLMVVDLCGFRFNTRAPLRTPFQTIALLTRELELYDPSILTKPAALVLNKLDRDGARKAAVQFLYEYDNYDKSILSLPEDSRPQQRLIFDSVFLTSAQTRHNIEHLRNELRAIMDRHDDLKRRKEGIVEFGSDADDNEDDPHNVRRLTAFLPRLKEQLM